MSDDDVKRIREIQSERQRIIGQINVLREGIRASDNQLRDLQQQNADLQSELGKLAFGTLSPSWY